jgi:caffeoyl-CoA O-methyltransferase
MLTGRVEGRFFQLMAQLSGARDVVEFGTLSANSALAMAEALHDDGKILTIERNPHYAKITQDFFDRSSSGCKIRLGCKMLRKRTNMAGGQIGFPSYWI